MKHSLLAPFTLALLAAPRLCLAQTTTIVAPKPAVTITSAAGATTTIAIPSADELENQLSSPYETARTFRGIFDVQIKSDGLNAPPLKARFKVVSRSKLGARLERDALILKVTGQFEGEDETFQILDNGRSAQLIVTGQKVGLKTKSDDALNPASRFVATLQKVREMIQNLDAPNGSSIVSLSLEEERPLLILSAKDNAAFRAVVDAQTRVLRSLELGQNLSIRLSQQTFNAPIPDGEFARTPLTEIGRAEVALVLPSFWDDWDSEEKSVPSAPAKPTPSK